MFRCRRFQTLIGTHRLVVRERWWLIIVLTVELSGVSRTRSGARGIIFRRTPTRGRPSVTSERRWNEKNLGEMEMDRRKAAGAREQTRLLLIYALCKRDKSSTFSFCT